MIKLGDILREVISKEYKIYCDLDGVLVDFKRGYKELTGHNPPPADSQTDKKAFWEPIDKSGGDFWAKLKWTSDGKQLWNFIKKYKPEILSSPSSSKSSEKGKKQWMQQHLPGVKLNLEQSKQKQKFAGTNKILIDDRDDICERWETAGGIAIHHTSTTSTIKKLKEILNKKKLNEVGEISDPYSWDFDFEDEDGNVFYSFKSPGHTYSVAFTLQGPDHYELFFNTEGAANLDTGEGVALKVLSTVAEIASAFITERKPKEVIFRPIKTQGDEDKRRFRVYKIYLEKNIPPDYKLLTLGDTFRLIKK